MKLSISNIAWTEAENLHVYDLIQKKNFVGLEIAPSKIFGENPYLQIEKAVQWKKNLPFEIPSMQSIWYGRTEKIFGTPSEREILLNYTNSAVKFAAAIDCKNLVFGCPKNRFLPDDTDKKIGVEFFSKIAEFALKNNTVIGMEANPKIYNVNYINTTAEALDLISQVNSDGFKLNLDVGTMIENEESAEILRGKVHLINHVHISEPYLKPIQERKLHLELAKLLKSEGYNNFISIEMATVEDLNILENAMDYVKGVFGD